jgi:hypothetical protein
MLPGGVAPHMTGIPDAPCAENEGDCPGVGF